MLLRNYSTIEVLNFEIDYGLELMQHSLEKQRDDRLYALWVQYYTNPFGDSKRKSWEEFRSGSTKTSTPSKKRGNISGVDLTKV